MLSVLRAAVSVSILGVLLWRTPLDALTSRAQAGSLAPLSGALALVLLTAALVALRWRALARWFGLALDTGFALRTVFLGMFGGQMLPSTLGTDLVRGWAAARHTGAAPQAAASVIADRLVALFAACLLVVFTLPWLGALAVAISAALLLGFLAVNRRDGALRPLPVLAAIAIAMAIHGVHVAAAAITAAAYGVDPSPGIWFAIMPVTLIACALPVSINGWGVREGVIVGLAGMHGVAGADALVVSLTLGVLNVVASLPGAYLLARRSSAAAA